MSGYGLSQEFHLSSVLEKNLREKGFNVDVINASVSGDTTTGARNRLNWLIQDNDIDIIILCLGANDMLRGISPDIVRNNLKKMLEIVQKKKIKIILAGMLAQEVLGKEYKKKFDNIYPELAKQFKISFLPFLLEGIALKSKYNLNDGKHPNYEGTKLISKNLEKKIIPFLIEEF